MNVMRHPNYLLATLLTASLATFGCSKSSDSSGSGGKASPDAQAALALMQKDTNTVFGINVSELTGSELYKKYKPMIESQMGDNEDFNDFKVTCGIDPLVDFKSGIMGGVFTEDGPKDKTAVVAVKGPDRAKVVECMKKMAEKKGGQVAEEGELVKITKAEGGEEQWVGWKDGSTTVMVPEGGKAELEAALAAKNEVAGNKDLMGMLGKVNQSATIWFAAMPQGGIKPPPMPGMPPVAAVGAYGSINLKSGLDIKAAVRFASADDAGKVKKQVDGLMDMAKGMAKTKGLDGVVEKLKLSQDGADMQISIGLGIGDIEKIAQMAMGGM